MASLRRSDGVLKRRRLPPLALVLAPPSSWTSGSGAGLRQRDSDHGARGERTGAGGQMVVVEYER